MAVRTVIERGPKGKRSVAFALDWLDHAWEMEDKDLSAGDGLQPVGGASVYIDR
jgi:hypothetical protein